jgi:hypothetical protein
MTWPLLAASLVLGLAALVRIADPTGLGTEDVTSVIRLPSSVTVAVATLFSLASLVFLVGVLRRMRSRRHGEDELGAFAVEIAKRPGWLQTLSQILSLVNFIVIVYLLWKNVLPLEGLMALGQGGRMGLGEGPALQPDAPFLITWTFALLAIVAAGGALAFALWFTSGERLARWWEGGDDEPAPPPLVEAVEESLGDLRTEPDARRAIIRSYGRFERAAAATGLRRRPWQTPMEFMHEALSHLPAPRSAIRTLTGLFELARFSDRTLGTGDRDRALDALDDIKGGIEKGRADAVAS